MFNFSKLSRPKTYTERLEDEQRRQAQDIANDDARRRARCSRSVNITLKIAIVGAIELNDGRTPGRIRLTPINDYGRKTLHDFVIGDREGEHHLDGR